MKKVKSFLVSLVAFSMLILACNNDDSSRTNTDNTTTVFNIAGQLESIFDNGIQPQIELLENEVNSFKILLKEFESESSNENFTALQDSWKQLTLAWKPLELVTIGDFAMISKVFAIHFWPIDAESLQINIENYTAENVEVDARAKGIGALEYILFSKDYNSFIESDNLINATSYLELLIDVLILDIEAYKEEWLLYEEAFKTSTEASVTGTQNKLVNEIVFNFFDILMEKIQEPTLAFIEGDAFLSTETPYSELSLQTIEAQIRFMEKLFSGSFNGSEESYSLYNQLAHVGRTDLVEVLEGQFELVLTNLAATNDSLETLILNNSDALDKIKEDIAILEVLISNDVVSALNIIITAGDNDGD